MFSSKTLSRSHLVALVVFILVLMGGLWFLSDRASRSDKVLVTTPLVSESTLQNDSPSATLEVFSPQVFVILPGSAEKSEATDGQKILVGSKIITGEKGRAQLLFPNKSVTRLDTSTEVTLVKLTEEPVQIEILLEKRRIWSRVAKLLGQESFTTETSTVTAAVRGTSFGHGILPDGRNRVISKRGNIETHCINKSQEAMVKPDKKILLDCTSGGALPLLNLDEQIKDKDEWYYFNDEQDNKLDERFGKVLYSDDR